MNWRHAIDTYRGHTIPHFKLIEHRNWWFLLSGSLIGLSLLGLLLAGLNFSIDFKGGAQMTYTYRTPVTVPEVTDLLASLGKPESQVQFVNGTTVQARMSAFATVADTQKVAGALARQAGISPADVSTTNFSATWGKEISGKALKGLVIVLLAIGAYIALRFEWYMAAGAMIALVHDVLITVGVYALVGREVTPATVIAVLTILGFSLYDTVVIYDKIKENTESPVLISKLGYAGTVNRSLNQVLMRSVNTSLVVLLPIASLLFFGGSTLKDFAFAMFVGVAIGAYSSIFIAAPVLTLFKERDPKYRAMDERRQRRGESLEPAVAAAGAPGAGTSADAAAVKTSDQAAQRATARAGSGGTPRPKSKRRPPAKKKRRR